MVHSVHISRLQRFAVYLCVLFLLKEVCKSKIDFPVIGPNVTFATKIWQTAKERKKKDDSSAREYFQSLEPKKGYLGFQGNTNSEFAELLLHQIVECEQDSVGMPMSPGDGAEAKKSTTVGNSKAFVLYRKQVQHYPSCVLFLSRRL